MTPQQWLIAEGAGKRMNEIQTKMDGGFGTVSTTSPGRARLWILLGVTSVAAVVFSAFVHMLIVAVQSQPECVPHSKAGEVAPISNTAAKSSC